VSRPVIRAQARVRSAVNRGSPAHATIERPTIHRLNVSGRLVNDHRLQDATARVLRIPGMVIRVQQMRSRSGPPGVDKKQPMAFLNPRLGIPGDIEPGSRNLIFLENKNENLLFGIGFFWGEFQVSARAGSLNADQEMLRN
jgi:hypothetical protein